MYWLGKWHSWLLPRINGKNFENKIDPAFKMCDIWIYFVCGVESHKTLSIPALSMRWLHWLSFLLHQIFQRRLFVLTHRDHFHLLIFFKSTIGPLTEVLVYTETHTHTHTHHPVQMIMCLSVYSIKHLDKYLGGWWVSRSAWWITAISPSSALFSASTCSWRQSQF